MLHHLLITKFVLVAPIDTLPVGTTGQLSRLDNYHVLLTFDDPRYEDWVFDIADTDPNVWTAIKRASVIARRRRYEGPLIAATVIFAFLLGAVAMPQPNFAREAILYLEHCDPWPLNMLE